MMDQCVQIGEDPERTASAVENVTRGAAPLDRVLQPFTGRDRVVLFDDAPLPGELRLKAGLDLLVTWFRIGEP